ISVIIPTYNEEASIKETIQWVREYDEMNLIKEIIIADGGSTDNTEETAKKEGAKVFISPLKGRSAQMNYGASLAKNEILYFLHADTIPPRNFSADIANAISKDFTSGCYRLSFDHQHWFLRFNCWFTRFNVNAVRFGDQSLFVTKKVFEKSGGFRKDLLMMEDQEIISRIKKHGRFKVMNSSVTTSARKYLDNGIYRMQGIFFVIWLMYYLGYSQDKLLKLYRRLIRGHKL
ncbi:MAG TPA: TIGR04283 family arsenosugar biosynthesis glycosyltransferase, partial [Hanamia sp.]|nr:TIGR04283 family arsenosugar biosynthesis glycosyltransferase [Hanamia sp.]